MTVMIIFSANDGGNDYDSVMITPQHHKHNVNDGDNDRRDGFHSNFDDGHSENDHAHMTVMTMGTF